MKKMMDQGLLGNKSLKGGFYRFKDPEDSTTKETLNFSDFEYRNFDYTKPEIAIDAEQQNDFTILLADETKYGRYAWEVLSNTLCYAADLVPNVNDSLVAIDDAMKLGYNWLQGPFEMIDSIGVDKFVARLEKEGRKVPEILKVASGKSFYITPQTGLEYMKFSGEYEKISREKGTRRFTEERRTKKSILSNKAASYFKVDNKVGMVEFHSKANALDSESMNLLSDAIDHAEENFRGLIIHNDSSHFSCGVNLECIAAFIHEKDWEGLDGFLDHFQQTMKKMKYSNIPVISAPAGLSIGGGFEVVLHTDRTVFHANSVTGLVESLVGVVPGGGGVKEMLYRWRDIKNNETEAAWATFMNIGYGKTTQSPMQAREFAMYRENQDTFVMNRDRLLDTAIDLTIQTSEKYSPTYRDNFIMPGREVWKEMQEWLDKTHKKGYLTPHDVTTGTQIAMIVTGGDIDAGISMSESDLFGLERQAFLKLARTDQTKSRINHMLSYGKPLRN